MKSLDYLIFFYAKLTTFTELTVLIKNICFVVFALTADVFFFKIFFQRLYKLMTPWDSVASLLPV